MTDPSAQDGYRHTPMGGPTLRTDIVDVYVFRRVPDGGDAEIELLQVLRAGPPLESTWHPIMGHVEPGERASETALRELEEEAGLARADDALLGVWALEQTRPYFVAALDCIVLGPRFVAEVSRDWAPRLNEEHSDARWIRHPFHGGQPALESFLWPGQRDAVRELVEVILPPSSPARDRLRITLGG